MCLCLQVLSNDESGVLKSPTIIVWGAMCALSFTEISLMNVDPCIWSIDIQNWEFILEDFTFDEYEVPILVFFDKFGMEADFIRY